MEPLTRFNNLRYEHFQVIFKGLLFEVKLLDDAATFPNSDNKDLCEEFKVIVSNGEKATSYKFYNSIMEKQISQIINNKVCNPIYGDYGIFKAGEFKRLMTKRFMWGGYDQVKNLKELTEERINHLLYSILNCFALDKETETESFKFFCDNFGYDEDSRKAEKIFKEVVDLKLKILTLKLTPEQDKYFNEEANQETEQFKKDVSKAINEAKALN